jgi:hypothetical protein
MFAYRLLIATTNGIDKVAERTIQGQETSAPAHRQLRPNIAAS